MSQRAKVILILLIFVGLLVAAGFIKADTARAEAPGLVDDTLAQSNSFAVAAAGVLGVVGALYLIVVGVQRLYRWGIRAGEWVWENRPSTRRERTEADALQDAIEFEQHAGQAIALTRKAPIVSSLPYEADAVEDWDRNIAPAYLARLDAAACQQLEREWTS